MKTDNPWSALPEHPPFILPIDEAPVAIHNETSRPEHRFNLELVPEPFLGREDAPVIVLTGNPRYREDDLPTHARADVRALLLSSARQEELEYPLIWLDPKLADTTGAAWYRSRLRKLCETAGSENVARNLAFYESLPYHSKELKQPAQAIPSQDYTDRLAQRAVRDGRIVIWQRGPWSRRLNTDLLESANVARPRSLQSSYLSANNLTPATFDRVVDALRT